MSAEAIDYAAVKAEHGEHGPDKWCEDECRKCHDEWPCDIYRLAVEVERLAGKVTRVEAVCERAQMHDGDGFKVTYVEWVQRALANQPEQVQP